MALNRSSTLRPGTAGARLEVAGPPDRVEPVLERHPEGVEKQPGYVWLDTPAKVLHEGFTASVPERSPT